MYKDSPFTEMKVENGVLKAFNWDGAIVVVGLTDGSAKHIVQGK